MSAEPEDEYFIALQDQRVFGAGIKRKRVAFVPAGSFSSSQADSGTEGPSSSSASTANRYLSIVLKGPKLGPAVPYQKSHSLSSDASTQATPPTPSTGTAQEICPICHLPSDASSTPTVAQKDSAMCSQSSTSSGWRHESSIAHQLCLTHVHPPSDLDRGRAGYKYLSSYGWDPDARLGLGAAGREGVLAPLQPRMKRDTMGVGVDSELRERTEKRTGKQEKKAQVRAAEVRERGKGKDLKMDAGQVRKRAERDRRKAEKLRQALFGDREIEKYLGEDS